VDGATAPAEARAADATDLKEATAAASALCKARFEALGAAGRARRIRPIPLDEMAIRYGEEERGAGCASLSRPMAVTHSA
jgi:hypothetical protein